MPTDNPFRLPNRNNPPNFIGEPKTPVKVDKIAEEENKDIVSNARRKRREQNSIHWGFVILIWIAFTSVGVAFFAKAWHLLMPDSWAWLNENHLKNIDAFLTTGLFSGGVGAVFKSKFPKAE